MARKAKAKAPENQESKNNKSITEFGADGSDEELEFDTEEEQIEDIIDFLHEVIYLFT